MEAISLSFDDFDLVINAFQLPCMNRIITVIQDSILVTPQGLNKLFDSRMVNDLCQQTPLLNGLLCPCSGPVGSDIFEFVFKDHHRIDDFVQLEQLFEVFSVFRFTDIPPVFQQEVFSALKDVFVGLGGFPLLLRGRAKAIDLFSTKKPIFQQNQAFKSSIPASKLLP